MAITVNDDNLTESKKQQLIDAASKAANIAPEDIVVSSFREVPKETAPAKPALPVQAPVDTGIDYRTIAIAAGAGILLFLLILFLIFGRRRRRQMKEDQELFAPFEGEVPPTADMEERAEEAAVQNDLGRMQVNPEDPVEQVRSFAQMNPEIIASMISSWLKEDKKIRCCRREKAGRESAGCHIHIGKRTGI